MLASLDGHWVTQIIKVSDSLNACGSRVCGRAGSPWQAPSLREEPMESHILPPHTIPGEHRHAELSSPYLSRSFMLP